MRREQRLRKRTEFAAVYRRGRVLSNRYLAIRVLPNQRLQSRFGFAVGKALGGAVVRNRLKRRLREAARSLPVAPGWDVVVICRQPAVEAEFATLSRALADLFGRGRLLEERAGSGS